MIKPLVSIVGDIVRLVFLTFVPCLCLAGNSLAIDPVFSPGSFWYQKIPENVPPHPQGSELLKELVSQIDEGKGRVNINYKAYSSPVFVVAGGHVKHVKVAQWNCQNKKNDFPNTSLAEQWNSVPIPDYVEPARGSDAELTIYDSEQDVIWEFWKARKDKETGWSACWGGRIANASKNPGYFDGYFGATATGLPFLGGQVTAEELARGEIRHVIGIALKRVAYRSVVYWPAQRSDGDKQYPFSAIPQGTRFRLSPSVNVNSLPLNKYGKVIARAAQKYGFVVWDKAAVVSIRAQNYLSYQSGPKNISDELLPDEEQLSHAFDRFPWDRVEFLPPNYGK